MKFRKIAAAVLAAAMLAATPATGALLSPLVVSASAEDTLTEGDYSYTLNEDGETVTITKYNGTDTEVDIPGILGGKNVTSIGDRAFYLLQKIKSVTIPDGVTAIGSEAFLFCHSLLNVTIPSSVTSIGKRVFLNCAYLTAIVVSNDNENYCSDDGILFNKNKTELIKYPGRIASNSYTMLLLTIRQTPKAPMFPFPIRQLPFPPAQRQTT